MKLVVLLVMAQAVLMLGGHAEAQQELDPSKRFIIKEIMPAADTPEEWESTYEIQFDEENPAYMLVGGIWLLSKYLSTPMNQRVPVSSSGMFNWRSLRWHGSTHIFLNRCRAFGYVFDSDPAFPLTFKLVKNVGYIYLSGRGKVSRDIPSVSKLTFFLGYE